MSNVPRLLKTVQVEEDLKSGSVLLVVYMRLEVWGVEVFQFKATLRVAVLVHCFSVPPYDGQFVCVLSGCLSTSS